MLDVLGVEEDGLVLAQQGERGLYYAPHETPIAGFLPLELQPQTLKAPHRRSTVVEPPEKVVEARDDRVDAVEGGELYPRRHSLRGRGAGTVVREERRGQRPGEEGVVRCGNHEMDGPACAILDLERRERSTEVGRLI